MSQWLASPDKAGSWRSVRVHQTFQATTMIVFCHPIDRIINCAMMVRNRGIAPLAGAFALLACSVAVHGLQTPVSANAQAFRAHFAIRKISDAINERFAA
ncbi:hypothetical protein [Cupriavidus sp. CuC1]|uniref:hypothetical protein n=1 Tax=Cupriavidus sp. CuC1 TaxID=3373131 RepID=UPI0037D073E6